MIVEERRQKVLELVNERGFVALSELAKVLNASESTIRRDLEVRSSARAPRRDSVCGHRCGHRAGRHQHVALAARTDRNPDADGHRRDQRHRPSRPHRAVPRPRTEPARCDHRGRTPPTAPDPDDRVRHHAGSGPARGDRRGRRRHEGLEARSTPARVGSEVAQPRQPLRL